MTTDLDSLTTTPSSCLQAWREVRSGYTGNHGKLSLFQFNFSVAYVVLLNSFVAFEISVLQIHIFFSFFKSSKISQMLKKNFKVLEKKEILFDFFLKIFIFSKFQILDFEIYIQTFRKILVL